MAYKVVTYNTGVCIPQSSSSSRTNYFNFYQYSGYDNTRSSITPGFPGHPATNNTYVYRDEIEFIYGLDFQLVKNYKFNPYDPDRLITEDKLDNCFLNFDKSLQFSPELFVPGTSFWKNVANNKKTNGGNYVTNQTVSESYGRYGLGTDERYCYMFYPKYPFDDVMNDWQTYVDYAYYDMTGIEGEFLDSSVNMAYSGYDHLSNSIVIGGGTANAVCSYKSNYFKYYPGDYYAEYMDQTDIVLVYPAFITKIRIPCFWSGTDYTLVDYYYTHSNGAWSVFYFHFFKESPSGFNANNSTTYCGLYESAKIDSVYIEDFELKINGDWYSINGWYTCC